MQITWLGHGTFQFQLPSGEVIVMDSWIAFNPKYPEGHEFSRTATPITFTTLCDWPKNFHRKWWPSTKHACGSRERASRTPRPMNKGGSQKVGPFTVTMTHALHSCGILDHGQIIYGGEAAGYVLRFADNRALYFSGDTNVFTDMQLIEQLYH